MVKGGTGFIKQASKRQIITYKKGSNHHVSSEVYEITDKSIININIVVGDESVRHKSNHFRRLKC